MIQKERFSLTLENQSKFQNSNIEVLLQQKEGCKTVLDVTVNPEAAQASYKKAVSKVKKEVSIPGFRKGKAPDSIILDRYQTHIEQEWKDILLNTTLVEAIQLIQLFPFNNKIQSGSIKSVSKQEGAQLTYEYEAAPVIPLIAPETLSIPEIKLEPVRQKDVDEALEELCLQQGEWNEITDRPVREGDHVVIDIDNIGENPENICTDTLAAVKPGKMAAWMRKLIIGRSPGDVVEGVSEKEDSNESKEREEGQEHSDYFNPIPCRIILHAIREAKPHPLDDELAKKLKIDSFQKLTEGIVKRLENNAEIDKLEKERALMEIQILTHYPFDMPASLVEGEVKAVRKAFVNSSRANGMEESEIQPQANKIEHQAQFKYERDFRLYFLTQKYAKEHHIEVTQDEVIIEWMRQLFLRRKEENTVDTSLDENELKIQIKLQILAMKVIDDMIQKANRIPKSISKKLD